LPDLSPNLLLNFFKKIAREKNGDFKNLANFFFGAAFL